MHDSSMPSQAVAMTTPEAHANNSLNDSPENHSSLYMDESPGAQTESDHTDSGDHPVTTPHIPQHPDVLQRLKDQVASVMQSHIGKDMGDLDTVDIRSSMTGHSPAASLPNTVGAFDSLPHHHRLSPQSLLAASIRLGAPSMVGVAAAAAAASGNRLIFGEFPPSSALMSANDTSPTALSQQHHHQQQQDEEEEEEEVDDERDSPREGSTSLSPRPGHNGSGQTPWNYEEQFKQLYEIDDSPKRREFLDDIFRFMHNRGSPINRLPIMAKQVLDLFELFNLVVARGGLVEVINKKLWQEIIKGLRLPSSITSAAFTLRTQYMKYLYPYECHTKNLSSPSELQSAIDGNRREGRRTSYNNQSYAELMQRSPLIPGPLHPPPFGGLPNGLTSTPHHPAVVPPLSLAGSRASSLPVSSTALGHPLPPSSPFFPGLGTSLISSPNDTLLTLWNLYNRRGANLSPPPQKTEAPAAPQSEALNLGVRNHLTRQEKSVDRERERKREAEPDRDSDSERERKYISRDNFACTPPSKKMRGDENGKSTPLSHTKLNISKGDSSMVVSMELDGVIYQGVLFAQTESAQS